MEMASIVSSTGCHIPCQYNEYKFLNIEVKPDNGWQVEGQITYGLWAVSKSEKYERRARHGAGGKAERAGEVRWKAQT